MPDIVLGTRDAKMTKMGILVHSEHQIKRVRCAIVPIFKLLARETGLICVQHPNM